MKKDYILILVASYYGHFNCNYFSELKKHEYLTEGKDIKKFETITEYAGKLVHQLINNPLLHIGIQTRAAVTENSDSEDEQILVNYPGINFHLLYLLSKSSINANKLYPLKRMKLTCSYWHCSTSWYCVN